jgi:hypothetical protein
LANNDGLQPKEIQVKKIYCDNFTTIINVVYAEHLGKFWGIGCDGHENGNREERGRFYPLLLIKWRKGAS